MTVFVVAQAYAELGFGYLRQGRLTEAQSKLDIGVALLKRSNRSTGFKVRAMKKLALCYLLNWHPLCALQEIDEGYELANDEGFHGQITRSMRVSHWISKRLFRRKRHQ